MTLQELREQRNALDAQIAKMEKDELEAAQNRVQNKILSYSEEEKKFMLSLLKHSCGSCKGEYPDNGYSSYNDNWRCNKCMLMEILEGQHGGEFDFDFDVSIYRVKV